MVYYIWLQHGLKTSKWTKNRTWCHKIHPKKDKMLKRTGSSCHSYFAHYSLVLASEPSSPCSRSEEFLLLFLHLLTQLFVSYKLAKIPCIHIHILSAFRLVWSTPFFLCINVHSWILYKRGACINKKIKMVKFDVAYCMHLS